MSAEGATPSRERHEARYSRRNGRAMTIDDDESDSGARTEDRARGNKGGREGKKGGEEKKRKKGGEKRARGKERGARTFRATVVFLRQRHIAGSYVIHY